MDIDPGDQLAKITCVHGNNNKILIDAALQDPVVGLSPFAVMQWVYGQMSSCVEILSQSRRKTFVYEQSHAARLRRRCARDGRSGAHAWDAPWQKFPPPRTLPGEYPDCP